MILATPATEADASATRVLLLSTSHSYRDEPFIKAAAKLDIEVVVGIDMPRQLADYWGVQLGLDYSDPLKATAQIVSFAQERSLAAIIAVDDSGALLAARASEALGLPHNSTESAEAARDKYLMRTLLSRTDLLVPQFRRFSTDEDRNRVAREATFPCVVKPLRLSGSRGVIRANNGDELVAAINRLERILGKLTPGPHHYLVEQYIPGVEVALEGILDGSLKVMALFDKPDPLVGPYFEETIYVTPSRLSAEVQARIAEAAAKAASAVGLHTGPIHAEMRINEEGPWVVELAGRSIGGMCSKTLRFGSEVTLEELILRQACGFDIGYDPRQGEARGVMMIPIPEAGLLKKVRNLDEARAVPLVDEVVITAPINYPLIPLPEGESYLGFIFAHGDGPEVVESALRTAYGKLEFAVSPMIPLLSSLEFT